eukprot:5529734-Alexandrium_andersonii.AAC.1
MGVSPMSTARHFNRGWDARMSSSVRAKSAVAAAPVRLWVGGRRHRSQAIRAGVGVCFQGR